MNNQTDWAAAFKEAALEHSVLACQLEEAQAVMDYYRRKMNEASKG